jgi:hypothetical protein
MPTAFTALGTRDAAAIGPAEAARAPGRDGCWRGSSGAAASKAPPASPGRSRQRHQGGNRRGDARRAGSGAGAPTRAHIAPQGSTVMRELLTSGASVGVANVSTNPLGEGDVAPRRPAPS